MKNLIWKRICVVILAVFISCWITKPALSQLSRSPAWGYDEPKMPFLELSRDGRGSTVWLVSGQVLKVEHKTEESLVTIHIDHVYAGPNALNDRTFEAHFSLDFSHAQFFDKTYLNTFAKGQRLITSVRWRSNGDPETNEYTGYLDYWSGYGFPLPTILDGSLEAREIEAQAQRVEAVYHAEDDAARRAKMEEYARASLPITSGWALRAIALERGEAGKKGYDFLRQLAKEPDVSLEKLGSIYAWLGQGNRYDLWTKSEERAELIKRIATTPQSADGGAQGWIQLSYIAQHRNVGLGVVPTSRLVGFYEVFVDNPTVSDATRLAVISQVGKLNLPKADVFSLWVSLLRPQAPGGIARKSALAVACANELLRNAPWSPEQNAQLQELANILKTEARAGTEEQASELMSAARILEVVATNNYKRT